MDAAEDVKGQNGGGSMSDDVLAVVLGAALLCVLAFMRSCGKAMALG